MRTARSIIIWLILITVVAVDVQGEDPTEYRRLSVKEYRDNCCLADGHGKGYARGD